MTSSFTWLPSVNSTMDEVKTLIVNQEVGANDNCTDCVGMLVQIYWFGRPLSQRGRSVCKKRVHSISVDSAV